MLTTRVLQRQLKLHTKTRLHDPIQTLQSHLLWTAMRATWHRRHTVASGQTLSRTICVVLQPTLSKPERKYAVTRKKMFALVDSLRPCRCYIFGKKIQSSN